MGNFPTTIWSYYCIVVRVRDSPEDVDGFGNLFPVLSHPDAGGFGKSIPNFITPSMLVSCLSIKSKSKHAQTNYKSGEEWPTV